MTYQGGECVPDLPGILKTFYFWLSYVVQFVIPFLSLLSMNIVIIHTLRNRSNTGLRLQGQMSDKGQGQGEKLKTSEKQIFAILLLVAFSFFILVTPLYSFSFYSMFVNYTKSPKAFAGFILFYSVMQKMYFTNNAINFFPYVISGQKFRNDFRKLLECCEKKENEALANIPEH